MIVMYPDLVIAICTCELMILHVSRCVYKIITALEIYVAKIAIKPGSYSKGR